MKYPKVTHIITLDTGHIFDCVQEPEVGEKWVNATITMLSDKLKGTFEEVKERINVDRIVRISECSKFIYEQKKAAWQHTHEETKRSVEEAETIPENQ